MGFCKVLWSFIGVCMNSAGFFLGIELGASIIGVRLLE